MDRDTVAVYDTNVGVYRDSRRGTAVGLDVDGWRADLGCGPGLDSAALGSPLVSIDASFEMLHSFDAAGRLQADLGALPLRRGVLAGAWASKSYQHVPHTDLPEALADLHRACAVDAIVVLTLFTGQGTLVSDDASDLPGRRFSLWRVDHLVDVCVGAGFAVDGVEERDGDWPMVRLTLRRLRTLPDRVRAGMRLLVVGLNPSLYSADRGFGFARPGNRFWPAMHAAGLTRDDIGMTDLVKRATVAAAELTRDEYADGVARVERLCAWLQPRAVLVVGFSGWRAAVDRRAAAGWQSRQLGGSPVYVMPNTSGLNASTQHEGFVEHIRAALRGPGDRAPDSAP